MYARMLSTKRREMHIVYGTSAVMFVMDTRTTLSLASPLPAER